MVSIIPNNARDPWSVISQQIGQNVGQVLPGAVQQGYHRGQLQGAFNQLDPNGNFLEQLKSIAPTLLSTPGGSQALDTLGPLLSTNAQNKAYEEFLKKKQNENANPQKNQSGQSQNNQNQNDKPKPPAPNPEADYRNPGAYSSPESLYPEQPTGPQETPELSESERNNAAIDLMKQSQLTGKPISFPEALQFVDNQIANTRNRNEQIKRDKQLQQQANSQLVQGMVNRAENSGLIKAPEDKTVAEKLALEAKRLPNENDQWKYVRTGMRKFDSSKANIERAADLGGPLTNVYRKGKGTYQDKNEIIKSVQPSIDEYKKYGLYDELRRDLSSNLGLGPEDIETAMFPLAKNVKKNLSEFPRNPRKFINSMGEESLAHQETAFPGNGFELDEKDFDNLKEGIYPILKDNPDINLVSFRGDLNQNKRYAWQDINKAVEQLIEEGRFTPDIVQEKQLSQISKSPAPGLLQLFNYFWTGAK